MNINDISRLPLYQCVSEDTQRRLLQQSWIIHINKNQHVFRIRDEVAKIYIVMQGFAVLERESSEHGMKTVFILGKGDIANEVILQEEKASINMRAHTALDLVVIPRSVFLDMMSHDFALNKFVIDSMAMKIRRLYRMVESSTKTSRLDHQIASRLWKLVRDFGVAKENYTVIPFEVRITFLASFFGTNRETVSRMIKKMHEEKILSIEHGVCKIYDVPRLQNYGKK